MACFPPLHLAGVPPLTSYPSKEGSTIGGDGRGGRTQEYLALGSQSLEALEFK